MTEIRLPDDLVRTGAGGRIVLVVLDGLGGLPHPEHGRTELETARTPNLDALAARSSLGMLTPVAPGVTPGSGPAHLALFGYDPLECVVGRGALSALGVGLDLMPGDLALRLNLATLDADGLIVDRRAGRPPDEIAAEAVERLRRELRAPEGVEFEIAHEKEHRAVMVLRGARLHEGVQETDPQRTGVAPRSPEALVPEAEAASRVLTELLGQARRILADGEAITGVLARGYALHRELPGFVERFGLRGAVSARYPMYRGVAKLVGMTVPGIPSDDRAAVALLRRNFTEFDFHFLHCKAPDARGEDGDFDGKVAAIEEADAWVPEVMSLEPEVLMVTGDHSTPAGMGVHSWHGVPLLVHSSRARPTGNTFGEASCRLGDMGRFEARHLMSIGLAHADRLRKFGA
jgi:2,3-bisphosphoglycerate-independent phosphoglycerate mutase